MTGTGVRPGRFRDRSGLVQVIGVEVALAALLFVPAIPRWWLLGSAAAVALIGLGRAKGRPWLSWLGQWVRWRSRVRADRRATAEPGPRLQLATIAERGTELGVGFDGAGWFAAVRLESEVPATELFADLTALLAGNEVPVSSVQLVVAAEPEAQRRCWFAVRLDVPGAHAVATERGGGPLGVHRALAGAVNRLLKGAEAAGIALRPMTAMELEQALTASLRLEPGSPERPVEGWRSWRVGETAQATFWLRGRPSRAVEAEKLWTGLSELTSTASTVSLALRRASRRPGDRRLVLRALIRLADEPSGVDAAGKDLAGLARGHKVRLLRCNGTQGPASYASALSGGAW